MSARAESDPQGTVLSLSLDMFRTLVLYSLLATSFAAPSSHGSSSSPQASAQCPATDIEGSLLDSASVMSDGKISCAWQIACDCVYNSPSGTLASGSSSCPKSIAPGSTSGSSSNGKVSSGKLNENFGTASLLADDDDDDDIPPSSGKLNENFETTSSLADEKNNDKGLSPAVIAAFTINGVFVLGILGLLAVCIFRRRKPKQRSPIKALYTGVENPRDTFVPLTHGTNDGPYYDPHEATEKESLQAKSGPMASGNSRFEDD
ncbi:hypothetical protein MIND_00024300 [Mycena indigotica]|uniref:Uncharacterized protein n=1 Tax=Mycena indigotica TaxID=2126181 RepID=A0A8H6TE68_9AGAR|nr:uncharacterized protein MIND_00024300 [Mycena indigotica]KAF7315101.1 hypothetical protein MIND_00024300 [Mycena indigotica]